MLTATLRARRLPIVVGVLVFFTALYYLRDTPYTTALRNGVHHGFTSGRTGLVHAAHRLPDADAFKSHFDAVVELPGLTVAEAMAGCQWAEQELEDINFQYYKDEFWIVQPYEGSNITDPRRQWQDFVKSGMIPYQASRFGGRGIVMAGGNGNSLERASVLLRQMVRLGSTMPVEIHHGKDEVSDEKKKSMQQQFPNLQFNDLSDPSNVVKVKSSKWRVNYHLKIAAILNSRFAEVLLLDTDNIPIIPPEDVFNSRIYDEYGAVFWPDVARTRPQNPIWAITNTACRTDEYEQESGQMLVNKHKFWYHLQLSMFMMTEDQAKFYLDFLLGDKDAFRFAWKALRTAYGEPAHWVTSIGFQGTPDRYCGVAFGQYHPDREDGRVAFLHANALKSHDPWAIRWLRENRGGVFSSAKKHPADTDYGFNFKARMRWDGYDYMPEKHMSGIVPPTCIDIEDVDAVPLEQVIPGGFQHIYDEIMGAFPVQGR